jgi:hypothetical protein
MEVIDMDIKERLMSRIWSLGKQIEKDEKTIALADSLGIGDDGIFVDLKIKNKLLIQRRAELSYMLYDSYGIVYPR